MVDKRDGDYIIPNDKDGHMIRTIASIEYEMYMLNSKKIYSCI